jgi:uncharacterized membrane protein HdeD (DUF308 family)
MRFQGLNEKVAVFLESELIFIKKQGEAYAYRFFHQPKSRYNRSNESEAVIMTKKRFEWTLSNLFATLLLIVGIGLLLWLLITSFGTRLSVEAAVTAGVLLLAGLIFLHPTPVTILAPMIGIISLSAGYATYFSAHSWFSALVAVIIMVAILSYGFNLRQALRRRHSSWSH